MQSRISSTKLKNAYPDIEFCLETTKLIYELEAETDFIFKEFSAEANSYVDISLSEGYVLTIEPMIRTFGGYPAWCRINMLTNQETKQNYVQRTYFVHCALLSPDSKTKVQFEMSGSHISSVVSRSLALTKTLCGLQLEPLSKQHSEPNNN